MNLIPKVHATVFFVLLLAGCGKNNHQCRCECESIPDSNLDTIPSDSWPTTQNQSETSDQPFSGNVFIFNSVKPIPTSEVELTDSEHFMLIGSYKHWKENQKYLKK